MTAQRQSIELRAKLYRGFADPSRLAILDALRDGAKTVGEIVQATGLSQPNASTHLSCLWDCGLVTRTQQGRYVHYQLSDARVAALLDMTDELLADVAKGVYECTRYTAPSALKGEVIALEQDERP
ncbi:winged helix-turn-helix transcriptional regulator [Chloroflexia bacterium SDU3-3]|nr:winged helix-turn-helix transcriptional regulator [Chloroflexia bacterium SDU3-3]